MAILEIRFVDDPAGWLRIVSPYSDEIRTEIKSLSYHERRWNGKAWLIHPNHVDFVRNLAQNVAETEGWTLRDFTVHSAEDIAAAEAKDQAETRELHIAAFLAVLPRLPRYCLTLVRWHPGEMVAGDTVYRAKGRDTDRLQLELTSYLDDADLFRDLQSACLDNRRETMVVGGGPLRTRSDAGREAGHPPVGRNDQSRPVRPGR